MPVDELENGRWCNACWLFNRKKRAKWYDPTYALERAGGLRDTPAGRGKYKVYLGWLNENEPARKALRFERMSKGWVIGSAASAKS